MLSERPDSDRAFGVDAKSFENTPSRGGKEHPCRGEDASSYGEFQLAERGHRRGPIVSFRQYYPLLAMDPRFQSKLVKSLENCGLGACKIWGLERP
jgi:hypothetical protein